MLWALAAEAPPGLRPRLLPGVPDLSVLDSCSLLGVWHVYAETGMLSCLAALTKHKAMPYLLGGRGSQASLSPETLLLRRSPCF